MPISTRRLGWPLWSLFAVLWFGALGYRHLLSPDEGRYATIAWDMANSGDWLTPRLNGVLYFEKPILQYWGTALGFKLFGYSEFVARLMPALASFLGVIGVYFTGRRLKGEAVGVYAAVLLGSSLWWIANGHLLTLDAGVSAWLGLAICAFVWAQQPDASERENRNAMLLAWALMALAVLQKGLIGLLLPGATLVLYTLICRDWRLWTRLHLGKGLLLFFAIATPWFVLVSRANPEFARFFFIHEHFERFLTTEHQREGAWWYFFPILIAGIMPWLSLLPAGLKEGWRLEDARFQTGRFLLIWAVFVFAFFSKSGSKLPSYILPMFPALALLIAPVLDRLTPRQLRWHFIPAGVLGVLLVVAAIALPIVQKHDLRAQIFNVFSVWLGVAGVVVLLCLALAAWLLRRGRQTAAIMALACTTLIGGQIAACGHDSFALTNSSFYLVQAVKPKLTPATRLYVYRMYDQTLPFYFQRHVQLVEYRDEFTFGQKQESDKFLDTAAFRQAWDAATDAVMIVDRKQYPEVEQWPGHVIFSDLKRMVIARNQEQK